MDLALALARAGLDDAAALADIRRLHAEMGIQPVVGPLPERRWLTRGAALKAAADA